MVKTSDGILDINPLERMGKLEDLADEKKNSISAKKKELEELEQRKKLEIEELDKKKRKDMDEIDKKKEKELSNLETKRKELKDLETQKIKEIQDAQELIEKSFQELMRQKRLIIQEDDDKKKNIKDSELKLEDVANSAPQIMPEISNMNYSKFFENLQTPQRLYDVTNRPFYEGLTELRNKAASGQITPEEEMFVQRLRNQFEEFNNNQNYNQQDQNQYVRRSMHIIEQIGTYQKLKVD